MPRSERNRNGTHLRAALTVLAILLTGPAWAFTLDAVPDGRAANGDLQARVVMSAPAERSVLGLELHVSAGEVETCAGARVPARLAAGASIDCTWRVPAGMDQAGLAAWVRYADGSSEVRRVRLTQERGAAFPQGIVSLAGSSVHDDTDIDGRLDAGETIDYAYRLVNTGTLDLDTLAVTDLDGGVGCPATTLASGQSLRCTRTHVITTAEAAAGQVANTVEVTGLDALGLPVQSSDQLLRVNLEGRAGIAVIKSPFLLSDADGSGFANLGDIVRYDFIVTNVRSETLTDIELVEPDPSLIDTPITCSSTTLDGNAFAGNGAGTLLGGNTVLCTATYEIRQADIDAGQALNLVEVSGTTPLSLTVNGSGASALVLSGPGALEVEKTVAPAQAIPGQDVVYTITVANTGPVTLFDVDVIDPLPTGIVAFDWTCAGTFCPNASGSGAISERVPAFPAGESLVYTVVAEVALDAPTTVLNVVTVLPPGLVECQPAGTPTPCEADADIEVRGQPIGVPALGLGGLGLLALALLAFGLRARP